MGQMLHTNCADALGHLGGRWPLAVMAMLLCVCVSDILWRRVSNAMVLTVWGFGISLWVGAYGLAGLLLCLGSFAVCLILGLLVWAPGAVGAADAKVFAAYGSIVGLAAVPQLIGYGLLFAALMGVVSLYQPGPQPILSMAVACLHPQGALARARKSGQTMPLTVALSGGVYVVLWGGPQWLV